MKRIICFLIFLVFNTVDAKIVLKPGVLDFEKLSDNFPELKDIISGFNDKLKDKILFKNFIKVSVKFNESGEFLNNSNIMERVYYETYLLLSNNKIFNIEQEEINLKNSLSKTPLFIDVKKKMVKFIITTKVKLGFGFIIQYDPEVILYMDRYMDFNRIVNDEIIKASKGLDGGVD